MVFPKAGESNSIACDATPRHPVAVVRLLILTVALLLFGFESASVCSATEIIIVIPLPLPLPSSHTATLLPSGKVLVTGGSDALTYSGSSVSNAFLYDPATGTWEATGAMNDRRASHTATLLPNGKVLVAGGGGAVSLFGAGSPFLASTELYDPATGTWTPTGTMNNAHSSHTATLLPNGKVFIAGGYSIIATPQSLTISAELYDPATGIWTITTPLNPWGLGHTATLLADGRVLVVGFKGGISVPGGTPNVEIYDPTTDTWTATGALNDGRSYHTATLLPDGKVLVTGGWNAGHTALLSSAELYDPVAGTWVTTGATSSAHIYHTATLLADGNVFVAGGSSELYHSSSGTWSVVGTPDIARSTFSSTLLPDGTILLSGDLAGDALSSTGWYQVLTLHTVTPSAGANGSISSNAVRTVIGGHSVGLTAAPSLGYLVDQWLVNGVAVQQGGILYRGNSYTLPNVTADTTVQVAFVHAVPRDFNNDGKADFLCQNAIGQITAWYLNGAGARTNWSWISTGPLGDWKVVGAADFNNDGNADILCQNNIGQIIVWHMDGAGGRTDWAYLSSGPLGDWRVVGTGDFNNDGNTDILCQNNVGQITVWYMNGAGVRTSWAYISSGPLGDWRVVGTGDFNNDGNTDILCQNNVGQITVWYMNGAGVRTSWAYISSGPLGDWRVVGTGDYNSDGNTDILCQNNVGQINVWYMNGAGVRSSWAWISTGPLGDWRVR